MNDGEAIYEELRTMALGLKPADLGLGEIRPGQPYGIVMDIDVDGQTATLTSFSSGDASLYLSTGGGTIGGGEHEVVANAARRFVEAAGEHLREMAGADEQPRPGAAQVTFYVLTSQGVAGSSRPEQDLGEGRDALSPLFYAGQDVITQLRLMEERRQPG